MTSRENDLYSAMCLSRLLNNPYVIVVTPPLTFESAIFNLAPVVNRIQHWWIAANAVFQISGRSRVKKPTWPDKLIENLNWFGESSGN